MTSDNQFAVTIEDVEEGYVTRRSSDDLALALALAIEHQSHGFGGETLARVVTFLDEWAAPDGLVPDRDDGDGDGEVRAAGRAFVDAACMFVEKIDAWRNRRERKDACDDLKCTSTTEPTDA